MRQALDASELFQTARKGGALQAPCSAGAPPPRDAAELAGERNSDQPRSSEQQRSPAGRSSRRLLRARAATPYGMSARVGEGGPSVRFTRPPCASLTLMLPPRHPTTLGPRESPRQEHGQNPHFAEGN
ncbi:hypothetical protein PAL_GLEAN10024664 [Pteropus alecto]|uniref:Uncharacterized protein n=1 Tax=Pteropus alecto TaxID=9402 RepID=L5K0V9_PTEAL|nr:hypothetical protein PAL_GLEAN10024664 [Pteropus alecto]